jgi:hypothetical protein
MRFANHAPADAIKIDRMSVPIQRRLIGLLALARVAVDHA